MVNIQDLREKAGMDRQELATELVVSKNTVESWENKRRFPNRKAVKKLCTLFKINVGEFYED